MAARSQKKSTLTRQAKTADTPSFPTDSSYQSLSDSDFDFPTLNTDGSVPNLIETHPPQGQRTPPAALGSLGVKMAGDTTAGAPTDLNDGQWDMVDDVSDISNDGNETVSIASDNLVSDDDDEDILTPDDTDSIIDTEDTHDLPEHDAGPLHEQLAMLDRQHKFKLHLARQQQKALQKVYEAKKEETLDSFLSDADLETPRQSTINAFPPSSSTATLKEDAQASSSSLAAEGQSVHIGRNGRFRPSKEGSKDTTRYALLLRTLPLLLLAFFAVMFPYVHSFVPNTVENRREALSGALDMLTNSTNATKSFNIEHLLPMPTKLPTNDFFGIPEQGTAEVHFQGAHPNHIIISLPSKALGSTPRVATTKVCRGDRPLAFNQTKLIDGVYAITLDPHDAHGIITVTMPCKKPELNVTVSHNFGRRLFQLPTFEKARTDLSTSVNKDVNIARARAHKLADRMNAGIAATHNVTSQLAQQMSHEAHVFANTAASVVGKWYSASDAQIRKDIMTVQENFARAETQVDDFVADMAGRVKRSVMQPLSVAQGRAGRIRAKYFGSDAAREKVCKRDMLVKDQTPSLFAGRKRTHAQAESKRVRKASNYKTGEMVEVKTCGRCEDAIKKYLAPNSNCLGSKRKSVKSTYHEDKDHW